MTVDYTVIDTETTGATNKTYGNPFTDSNRLWCIGTWNKFLRSASSYFLYREGNYTSNIRDKIKDTLRDNLSLAVGFNFKFDLHWLRRYGLSISDKTPIWDCQLAEFIINNQQEVMPSLENTVAKYGIGGKFLDIETEYWNKGIDTDQIPEEITRARVESDVEITARLFELQMDYLKSRQAMKRLIWVACQDLHSLAEMEWNGLKYDLAKSIALGDFQTLEMDRIRSELNSIVGVENINWASGDHLSAVLYGGILAYDGRENYIFTYKDGRQVQKSRKKRFEVVLPRRAEPLSGSEYAKGGYYSTDATTLKKIKIRDPETKRIVSLVQRLATLEKQVGTYYHGIPKLYNEMEWTNGFLHGNLNSCTTRTGRLSSTKPNQQNMDGDIRECIVSRF